MKTILESRRVSKTYDMGETFVHVLNAVDVKIGKGEYVSITGPSGSGKTTLLDILSGLLRPTSGEVVIDGLPISRMDDNMLAHIRGKTIGFVFQSFHLISRMTALDNVMLPLWFQGIPLVERKARAEKVLREVGLGDRMHHRPNQLSGGQRQRVAIGRALAVDPEIIVADEPTGNLDSLSGANILNILDELHAKRGKTILVVTHEKYVAERASRVIHLMDGRIQSSSVVRKKQSKIKGDYK